MCIIICVFVMNDLAHTGFCLSVFNHILLKLNVNYLMLHVFIKNGDLQYIPCISQTLAILNFEISSTKVVSIMYCILVTYHLYQLDNFFSRNLDHRWKSNYRCDRQVFDLAKEKGLFNNVKCETDKVVHTVLLYYIYILFHDRNIDFLPP